MSRLSWSSTGSDEVRRHFDLPFDHDHRQHFSTADTVDGESGSEQDGNDHHKACVDAPCPAESCDKPDSDSIHTLEDATSASAPARNPIDDSNDRSDQAICRICLEPSSSDASGGESLGRLLSPCRCKGTMKYVHATCLDQWRAASARSSSAVACDQCGAPYRFRKSKFVGLATSPTLLFVVSLFLFLLLIWTVGVVATLFMDFYDRPPSPQPASKRSRLSRWWRSGSSASSVDPNYDPLQTDAWSYLDADYASPGIWSYSLLIYEPAAYIKLIKEAVRSFASGEAVDAVKEVVGLQDTVEPQQNLQSEAENEPGFWSTLKNEWMYGDGGLWEKYTSPSAQNTLAHEAAPGSIQADTAAPDTSVFSAGKRERYDARTASDANLPSSAQRRSHGKSARSSRHFGNSKSERQGWLSKLLTQFSVGFSLVGILSFVNLVIGASFLGPINWHNFGLGRSFARMTSGGRAGGRNGNRDGANIASILIVLLVMIGVLRALHVVYKLVKKGARRGLSRLEAVIVDWNHEDGDEIGEGVGCVTATDDRLVGRDLRQRQAFVQGEDE